MHIADAMEIVLDLAKLSVAHFPNVPEPEQKEAREALALVEDFVVNYLGDDEDVELDDSCYCSCCGRAHTEDDMAGGRCLGCGTMICSELPKDNDDETEEDEVGVHVFKGASIVDDCGLCGRRYALPCHGYMDSDMGDN